MLFRNKENALLKNQVDHYKKDMQKISAFLNSISEGKLDESMGKMDSGEEFDLLADNLRNFQQKLKVLRQEEHERNWVSEGIASFVDILRSDEKEIKNFYDKVLSELVKYLKANQVALFVVNKNESGEVFLEMTATYAYNRKKFLEKKIYPGEGLVGQCYMEGETIYLTDIPEDYISITSGLGNATPNTLFIVPLIYNEQITGILEIASFSALQKFEREFLVKLSESIASFIHNINVTQQTRTLLEASQRSTEELRMQEEELRQNLEEMAALQEQIEKQLAEAHSLKEALEVREKVFGYTTILTESDKYGTITYANDKMCEVSGYTREELIGKPHNILRHKDMQKEIFRLMWETIKNGKVFQGIVKNRTKSGDVYWVDATIVPVIDEDGNLIKYIGARYHIKNEVMAEELYQKQLEALGLLV